jgi:hypothetical protein
LKDREKDGRLILVWILAGNEEGRWMEIVRDCVQRTVFGGVGEACGRAQFVGGISALALEGQLGSHARGFSRRHSKEVSPSTVTKQLTPHVCSNLDRQS